MKFDGSYTIYRHKKFADTVNSLPKQVKSALDEKLAYLAQNPSHPSLNTKPYSGLSVKTKKQLEIDEVFEFYINRKEYRCLVYVSHARKELILMCAGTHKTLKNFVRNQ